GVRRASWWSPFAHAAAELGPRRRFSCLSCRLRSWGPPLTWSCRAGFPLCGSHPHRLGGEAPEVGGPGRHHAAPPLVGGQVGRDAELVGDPPVGCLSCGFGACGAVGGARPTGVDGGDLLTCLRGGHAAPARWPEARRGAVRSPSLPERRGGAVGSILGAGGFGFGSLAGSCFLSSSFSVREWRGAP